LRLLRSAYKHYGAEIPEAFNVDPHINEEMYWEKREFDNATERWDFSQCSHLRELPDWISSTKKTSTGFGGLLIPGVTSIPPDKNDITYVLEVCGLTIDGHLGGIRFDRKAIALDTLDLRSVSTASHHFANLEAVVVIPFLAWEVLAVHGQQVRNAVAIPLCIYSAEVSMPIFRRIVVSQIAPPRVTMVRGFPFADVVLRIDVNEDNGRQLFYLFFVSNALGRVYSSLCNDLSLSLDARSLNLERQEDRVLALACWVCTMGTIGATAELD
jgi:hypothetical protein